MARGNVYWYYDSKDDIFAAVMDRMLSREIRTLVDQAHDPVQEGVAGGPNRLGMRRPVVHGLVQRPVQAHVGQPAHQPAQWVGARLPGVDVMAECGLDGEPDIDAALLSDVAVAVFEGANVPNDRNRPAHEMLRFLMESTLVGRSPIKGRDH